MNDSKKSILFYGNLSRKSGCVRCGKCCGIWPVPASTEEIRKISRYSIPGFDRPEKWFVRGHFAKKNGKCLFLSGDNTSCAIHSACGVNAKALACRLYPLELHRWADGSLSVSQRYDCPAAASGKTGVPLSEKIPELEQLAEAFRGESCRALYGPGADTGILRLREIAEGYRKILCEEKIPLSVRVYSAACLLIFHTDKVNRADIFEAETFADDAYKFFKRSAEHLAGVLENPGKISPDKYFSFRVLLLGCLRDDPGKSLLSRIAFLCNAVLFASGGGSLESAGGFGKNLTSKNMLGLAETIPCKKNAFRPFVRWISDRLSALHFCGSAFSDLTFEEGISALLLQYPFARILAAADASARGESVVKEENVLRAMIVLDHGFLRTGLFRKASFRRHLRNVVPDYSFAVFLKDSAQA